MSEKETTKVCPNCESTALVELRSINRKICSDCGKNIPWYLEPGQKPLLTKTRVNNAHKRPN